MGEKLSRSQRLLLEYYDTHGRTSHGIGTMNTWRSCIRNGWLMRSYGIGVIETEITDAGRAALSTKES